MNEKSEITFNELFSLENILAISPEDTLLLNDLNREIQKDFAIINPELHLVGGRCGLGRIVQNSIFGKVDSSDYDLVLIYNSDLIQPVLTPIVNNISDKVKEYLSDVGKDLCSIVNPKNIPINLSRNYTGVNMHVIYEYGAILPKLGFGRIFVNNDSSASLLRENIAQIYSKLNLNIFAINCAYELLSLKDKDSHNPINIHKVFPSINSWNEVRNTLNSHLLSNLELMFPTKST